MCGLHYVNTLSTPTLCLAAAPASVCIVWRLVPLWESYAETRQQRGQCNVYVQPQQPLLHNPRITKRSFCPETTPNYSKTAFLRKQCLQLQFYNYTWHLRWFQHRFAEHNLGIHNWCLCNNTFCNTKKAGPKNGHFATPLFPELLVFPVVYLGLWGSVRTRHARRAPSQTPQVHNDQSQLHDLGASHKSAALGPHCGHNMQRLPPNAMSRSVSIS